MLCLLIIHVIVFIMLFLIYLCYIRSNALSQKTVYVPNLIIQCQLLTHVNQPLFHRLMKRCWSGDPDQRPLYPDILQTLTTLLTHSDTNIILDDLPCLSPSESEVDSEHNL